MQNPSICRKNEYFINVSRETLLITCNITTKVKIIFAKLKKEYFFDIKAIFIKILNYYELLFC